MIYETNYIMHYNYNHDKLGRFAKGTNIGMYSKSTAKKLNKIDKMAQKFGEKGIAVRKDDKIAKKLERMKGTIRKENTAYRLKTGAYKKLDELAYKAENGFVSRKEFKSVRDDIVKARNKAVDRLEWTVARIGERKLDLDFDRYPYTYATSQHLGSNTWHKINNIIDDIKFDYDYTIGQMDYYLKNTPKNESFGRWAMYLAPTYAIKRINS